MQVRFIGIFANYRQKCFLESAKRILALCVEKQIEAVMICSEGTPLESQNYLPIPHKRIQDCVKLDALVSLGGDGTMLRAAKEVFLHSPETAIIGVHIGTLGFLSSITYSNSPAFDENLWALLQGPKNRKVLKRSLLTVCGYSQGVQKLKDICLNEVVISGLKKPVLSEYKISIDQGSYVIRSDGVLCSTASGSTGYALSLGGPIVDPASMSLILLAVAPHSLASRPLVLRQHRALSIENTANPRQQKVIQVVCDGKHHTFTAVEGYRIDIAIDTSKFLVHWYPADANFLTILQDKLRFAGSVL